MPSITFQTNGTTDAYYKTNDFQNDHAYVLTYSGTRALGDNGFELTYRNVTVNASGAISSTVTNDMLWNVVSVTDDGVITLQNASTGNYLDWHSYTSWGTTKYEWHVTTTAPQYVRYIKNTDGTISMYYRENLNAAVAYYLKAPKTSTTSSGDATDFTIYQQVHVKDVTTTVINNVPEYPIRIKKVDYKDSSAIAGATFSLYKSDSDYDKGELVAQNLVSDSNGVLYTNIALSAGYYYLEETSAPDGYAPLNHPVLFYISRAGRLTVNEKEFASYNYVDAETVDSTDYLLLKVPNKPNGAGVGFKKIDGFGAALGGATFTVYQEYECTNVVELTVNDETVTSVTSASEFSSDTGYNVSFTIATGTYYLKETAAPEGYESNAYVYKLTVEGEDAFTIERMSNSSTTENPPNIATYGVLNTSKTTRTAILRKVKDADYTALAGATFEVLRYDRTLIEGVDINGATTTSFTSGSNGIYLVKKLPLGTYYLHETTVPEGYASISDEEGNWFTLTVAADGITVTQLSAKP